MKNNNKVKVLISLIMVLSACTQTPGTTVKTPEPVHTTQPPVQSPDPTPTPIVKPYTLPDIKNNFVILDPVPLSNSVPTLIDDNGNGMFIFKGSGLKISNFQPSGELFPLDSDFGDSWFSLDEKGNGLIIWGPAHVAVGGNETLPKLDSYLKYKKITNYKAVGDAIKINNKELNLSGDIKFNLDENGNGRIICTKIISDTFTISTFAVNNYVISETIEKSAVFQGQHLYLDKNGNGFLQPYNNQGKIALVKIQNLITDPQPIIITPKALVNNPGNLIVDFDLAGNGFISLTYDYSSVNYSSNNTDRAEIIIKKLSGFNVVGEEINLGSDYSNRNKIKLDQDGNGIVVWMANISPSDIYIREIKKYIPQNPVQIKLNKNYTDSFDLTLNKFGDGLITWQNYSYETFTAKFYGRLITNYSSSSEDVIQYTPLPMPTPYPVPSGTSPYVTAPDGKLFEPVTVHGNISDNNGNPLKDVTVRIKSFTNSSVEIPEQITPDDGHYLIRSVPVGNIEITASKNGYITKSRMETAESNQEGNPEKNKFDFTSDFALVKG